MSVISSLTYLGYLALVVVPPATALVVAARMRRLPAYRWAAAGLMATIALLYTTPWDNYLVARGVWYYGDGTVFLRMWHAPLGEYLFVVVQSVGTALWLSILLDRTGVRSVSRRRLRDVKGRERAVGVVAGALLFALGAALLAGEATFYLGAILAWAAPVCALQWAFGWRHLWTRRRTVALGVAVPTAFLWAADRLALGVGLWALSPRYTTGLSLGGLPIEEAAFFLVTNLFVAQGLVLLDWLVASDRTVRFAVRRVETEFPAVAAVVRRWA